MKKTAWVAGASGVIGSHLIDLLSEHPSYEKVVALVRKPVTDGWGLRPDVEQWVVDYNRLQAPDTEAHVDDLFCALGSTTKKTPDKKDYYQIDVQYPVNFAEFGIQHGARFYGLVSAHGANEKSFSFYLKMKGELERLIKKQAFHHITIARPSLLLGERKESRTLESLSGYFMKQMPGNYKAIEAIDVAAALIQSANSKQHGTEILPSKRMQNTFIQ